MKVFKKFPVAVAITAVIVALCLGYSALTAPAALPNVTPGDWVYDGAGVLSEETETQVRTYNSQFDRDYEAYVAVLTVESERNWSDLDFAQQVYEDWNLGGNDFLLILDVGGRAGYLYYGSNYSDFDYESMLATYVDPSFYENDCDGAVLSLMEGMDQYLSGLTAAGAPQGSTWAAEEDYYDQGGYEEPGRGGSTIVGVILLILVVLLILSAIDRARYDSWYRTYGAMPRPPVRFVPLLFWHRPGSAWFRRRPPRGPGGFGGPGPGPGPGPGGPRPGSSAPRPGSTPRPRSSAPRPGSTPRPRSSTPRPRGGGSFGGGGSRSGGFGGGGRSGGRSGGFGGGGRSGGHR